MSLLREIQNAAIDGSSDLETLLRKCRVLAARLKNEEYKIWVQSELDSYRAGAEVPDYRIYHGNVFGHFSGDYGRQLKNAQIPHSCIPIALRNQLTKIDFRIGVAELDDLARACESGILQIDWPADLYPKFENKIFDRMNLIQAWIQIPKSVVVGILSTVRNRILEFALEIEAANPDAGEVKPDEIPIPEERVTQIFNTYIFGTVGSIASGKAITQKTQQNINSGDFKSLESSVRDLGLTDSDIAELRQALDSEEVPSQEGFGPKVAGWLGKAVSKVAEGGIKISTSVASNVLSEALKNYYGL